jgi:hypothetical protein
MAGSGVPAWHVVRLYGVEPGFYVGKPPIHETRLPPDVAEIEIIDGPFPSRGHCLDRIADYQRRATAITAGKQ